MAMGRRKAERQAALFLPAGELPKSPGHPFYQALNRLLAEAEFDRWAEERCRAYYVDSPRGQPSLPPGVYFRMLFVGYYEGIGSQRGIAWRCADSNSIREFLGIAPDRSSPDHSTLSLTRTRLPPEVFQEVFEFVLRIAHEKKLLKGETVGVDSTTLEADAAMKSIVRRDTGEDWKTYVAGLMRAEGVIAENEQPSDEDVRRFDKTRKDKTVSNEEWFNPYDPEAKIAKMKDGTTHLAYKAEHVVDLDSDLILAAEIRSATDGDAQTLADSVMQAQANLRTIGSEQLIEEVAADKGYHSADALELCRHLGFRTYLPEPKRTSDWTWTDKTPEHQAAVHNNRQRVRRRKGKQRQRRRSEVCERTFAHVCDSGGMRRTWLKKLVNVTKRYLIATAAHNLGRMLRTLFGVGKPRALQGFGGVSADGFGSESAPGQWIAALRARLTGRALRASAATPRLALAG
ncbi:MAG TPA: transposase [Planctomycetaceae bacterium]|nr:transposase [Planctomycetaceae bacterium]